MEVAAAVVSYLMNEISKQPPLVISLIFSYVSCISTILLIPTLKELFLKADLYGHDAHKLDRPKVPEAIGVVCGMVFLTSLFLFIPFLFYDQFVVLRQVDNQLQLLSPDLLIPLATILSALLSIACMILLGFADDVLDLRWRHKLLLPTISTIPLLVVYLVAFDRTVVVIPKILHPWLPESVDLGFLFYVFMGMLAVFCTNSINILAGINGVEAGQSLVIALSISVLNWIQIVKGENVEDHTFSLYIMLPFIGVTLGLLWHNWWPSKVFVGDTYCYFAGMTFAVVGILGHFSKTMLLFFIPQIFNFIFSAPQLFRIVDCPRHRMPDFNKDTQLLEASKFDIGRSGTLGKLIIKTFSLLGLVSLKTEKGVTYSTNFTLINLVLIKLGPTREDKVTIFVLLIQLICSLITLFIRFSLVGVFYS